MFKALVSKILWQWTYESNNVVLVDHQGKAVIKKYKTTSLKSSAHQSVYCIHSINRHLDSTKYVTYCSISFAMANLRGMTIMSIKLIETPFFQMHYLASHYLLQSVHQVMVQMVLHLSCPHRAVEWRICWCNIMPRLWTHLKRCKDAN